MRDCVECCGSKCCNYELIVKEIMINHANCQQIPVRLIRSLIAVNLIVLVRPSQASFSVSFTLHSAFIGHTDLISIVFVINQVSFGR